VLVLPKLLATLLIAVRGAAPYGGVLRLTASVLSEILMSTLLAPVRMLFHSRFVVAALFGWGIQWKSPPRADLSTLPAQAVRRHGAQTVIGIAWVAVVAWKAPESLPWIALVATGLLLAVPISVLSSYSSLGSLARRAKFFLTPNEAQPPRELTATAHYAADARPLPRFVDAAIDPDVYAAVRAVARARSSPLSATVRDARIERALLSGPAALSANERTELLNDATALDALHRAVRTAPVHPSWYASSTSGGRATIKVFRRDARTRHATVGTVAHPR
jgi:membrane glycosyltransferase